MTPYTFIAVSFRAMNRPSAIVWLLTAALGACAQQKAPKPPVIAKQKFALEKVYTYVEQMPELPGGGGTQAIANELMRALQVPKLKEQLSWPHTKVSFTVSPDGKIYDEQVFLAESIPEYRRAMLNAVRALPKFKPGYQEGKPVAVKLTLAFSCIMVQ